MEGLHQPLRYHDAVDEQQDLDDQPERRQAPRAEHRHERRPRRSGGRRDGGGRVPRQQQVERVGEREAAYRITSYNVCYTKLLRARVQGERQYPALGPVEQPDDRRGGLPLLP